ncbi:OmpA family protein [Variovorax sp. dw_954]|uniref:OmpA family protein n=1 Tax=Variovorax sp. dw_954 TaxID=2720078 RepID=UPI001BD3C288|nr:OmpA family protein [Variovorax sp. dw_954]
MPIAFPKVHATLRALLLICIVTLAACAAHVSERETGVPFEQAVDQSVDDLFAQTQKLPAFMATVESKVKPSQAIVIDPLLDGTSGQQTDATKGAEQRITERVRLRFRQFSVSTFDASGLAGAQYVLNGTLTRTGSGQYRLSLALTEIKSGVVLAQAASRVADSALNANPTAAYRDSPVIAKDRVVEGYIRTSQTRAGQPADALYLERLPTSALLADANAAYNDKRYADALARYEAASQRPDGQQMSIYSGLYLTQTQLGQREAAEKTFGQMARLGLATNNLSVKFLFKPGSTDFVGDARVSGPYPMWLRQIARQSAQIESCVVVTGHTSKTGSETVNDRLSLQRATVVKKRLETETPELGRKLREAGLGFRENIVGTGTDDMRDALDRRVEFKVVGCVS